MAHTLVTYKHHFLKKKNVLSFTFSYPSHLIGCLRVEKEQQKKKKTVWVLEGFNG